MHSLTRRTFLLGSAAIPAAVAATPGTAPLRLMSFNIRYANNGDRGPKSWASRRDTAAAIIRDFRPDVVGLQEALRPQLDDLASRLPDFKEIGVGRDDGRTAGEYSALLVRREAFEVTSSGTFWLSDSPAEPGSMTWGNRIPRICTWSDCRRRGDGLAFSVFNAHFDHQSQPSREKSAAAVVSRLRAHPAGRPCFFMGDLNATADNPAIATLKAAGLADTWRLLHPDTRAQDAGTFHDFTGRPSGPRIDYIFTPQAWKTLEASIVRTPTTDGWPSDHFPVTAIVTP